MSALEAATAAAAAATAAPESVSPSALDIGSSGNECANGCGADDAEEARAAVPSPAPSSSSASSEEGSSAAGRAYAPARCNEAAVQQLLQRTGYSISAERGQRRYAKPDFVPQGSLK